MHASQTTWTPVVATSPIPHNSCVNITQLHKEGNPVLSSLMFTAGVVGNVAALTILGVHRKEMRTKTSSFCILVTGLAITDLLGTSVLSPVVFVAYTRQATLLGLADGNAWLCNLFAFAMMFFNLAAMLILCAMAVERCLAISYPYFYSQHNIRKWAKASLPAIYAISTLFCALPFLDVGKYKQYCPGTWCFIQMEKDQGANYSLSYATVMALLILAVFVCNGLVIVSLCQMYRKQKARRRGSLTVTHRRRKSWFAHGEEEVDYLVLLALMTAIFVICSLPLTVSTSSSWMGERLKEANSKATVVSVLCWAKTVETQAQIPARRLTEFSLPDRVLASIQGACFQPRAPWRKDWACPSVVSNSFECQYPNDKIVIAMMKASLLYIFNPALFPKELRVTHMADPCIFQAEKNKIVIVNDNESFLTHLL